MNHKLLICCLCFLMACETLDTVNNNNPDRTGVLTTGTDLLEVLEGGYISWWQGIHDEYPTIALGVAGDAYGMSWADFGAQRFGEEPRTFYNNRFTEEPDYRQVAEGPWFGCLSAVSSANDVLLALENGVSIDNGGPQDESIKAASLFLRGVSWGYLGLIFDQALIVDEQTDLDQDLILSPYSDVIARAISELEQAIGIAESVGIDFTHNFFNGVQLDLSRFTQLSNSYAARFLAQMPRTAAEKEQTDWLEVSNYTGDGLTFDFAPIADGGFWVSYHDYVFAETGLPPFWARVDQRVIAAMDANQPTRYPEVMGLGETPLTEKQASSVDQRLVSDFIFLANNNFPADRGEWHYSHYKHNRNVSDPSFAGNGSTSGPMPTFLAADNQLLRAEALLNLGLKADAISILNNGTRVQRGRLNPIANGASMEEVMQAISYERAIELFNAAPMGLWLDRRRVGPRLDYREVDALGGLQFGTPAQLPVPDVELRIQNKPAYNFGGQEDPLGIERVF